MIRDLLKFSPDVAVRSTLSRRQYTIVVGTVLTFVAIVGLASLTPWPGLGMIGIATSMGFMFWGKMTTQCPYCNAPVESFVQVFGRNNFETICSNCRHDLSLGFDISKAVPPSPYAKR